MKAIRFIAAAAAIITISFTNISNAQNYVSNDTKNSKGQIVQRVICENSNNYLTPYRMILCKYNDNGALSEKKTMKWSSQENQWSNFEIISYDYSKVPVKVIVMKWDNKSKKYIKE